MGSFYITTTLPYVNSEPHIGFAMEIVRADVLARLHRLLGDEVLFSTGTDEHGQKIYQKALEAGVEPVEYCNKYSEKFRNLKNSLNLSVDHFIRTTDKKHITAAQEFWKRCFEKGDIYKKNYQVKYCVGCELEKTDSDLVNGKCPDHPDKEMELRDEENYFFRFSRYQEPLLDFYKSNLAFVEPEFRMKEITKFVEGGLADFSISRLKSKMPWGVEVPGDPEQVMYVWFDALVNYISTIDWPEMENFEKWWPGVQVCGKDNLRQQTAMWQAMLMSAGLPNSKKVFVNGFILNSGQKMSKSLGNVIDPLIWVEKYGTEAVRYFLLSSLSSFEDSDVTEERFKDVYTADLVNGIGNVVSRIAKLASMTDKKYNVTSFNINDVFFQNIVLDISRYRFDTAISGAMGDIRHLDGQLALEKPWEHVADAIKFEGMINNYLDTLARFCVAIKVFLPETSRKIEEHFGFNSDEERHVEPILPMFPRIK